MKDPMAEWAKELLKSYPGRTFFDMTNLIGSVKRNREIAAEMMLRKADVAADKMMGFFCGVEGYQTPKVDTRAAIFQDGKILLICEKGRWSVPGGSCEFSLSRAENIIKETKEEEGLDMSIRRVIAVKERGQA